MSIDTHSVLRLNSRGEEVQYLQSILNRINYGPLNEDGIFGSATKAAVERFQVDFNLKEDGIVGSDTWAVLQAQVD
jgi:peptidoglycan hydrolase-like protein with peptidoglycan-binding domain